MGNLEQESGCNPEVSPWKDNGTSYGICQWTNERKTALKEYAKNQNADIAGLYLQLDNMMKEMREDYSSLYEDFMWATDAKYVAGQFCYKFEQAAASNNIYTHTQRFLDKYAMP